MASRAFASTSIFIAPAAAIFMAGYGYAFSQNAVVQLYDEQPAHSTSIFKRVFYGGAYTAIGCSCTSAICSAYLAYLCTSSAQRRLYIIAALTAITPMPYTGTIMMPGIKRLIAISEDETSQKQSAQTLEHRQLMREWVMHNYLRTALYTFSGGIGLWAAIFG